MKDFMSKREEEIRDLYLKDTKDLEEAHYVHTINAFVELIVVYGYDKVIGDLRIVMSQKEW